MNKTDKPLKYGINQNDFGNQIANQNFTNAQIYTKGFDFNTTAGTPDTFPIQLGGKARKLHGIVVFNEQNNVIDADKISLVINSEQIINNVIWWAYNPQGQAGNIFKDGQYFAIPRKLSGADDCQFVVDAVNAHKIFIVFYLSDI